MATTEDRQPSRVDRLVRPVRDVVLDSVDPDEVVARIDINALLDRVDVNVLLDRVDVDRLLDRVDVDRLLDRVDPDRLLDRVDVDRIVRRVDTDRIVASSTGRVAGSLVDVARRQLVGLDAILVRSAHRLRGLDPADVPAGPPALVGDGEHHGPADVSGRYAGPLTRLVANGADVAAGFGLFTVLSAGLGYLASLLLGVGFDPQGVSGIAGTIGLALTLFLYAWLSIAIAGRTPAMAILGVRVVNRAGRPLSTVRAAVRTLLLPVSALAFGAGFLGLLLGRERRGLHDVIAGSAVVYDWGDRTATMPTPLADWLSRHEAPPPGG